MEAANEVVNEVPRRHVTPSCAPTRECVKWFVTSKSTVEIPQIVMGRNVYAFCDIQKYDESPNTVVDKTLCQSSRSKVHQKVSKPICAHVLLDVEIENDEK